MEVVLGVVVLSQTAIFASEMLLKRREAALAPVAPVAQALSATPVSNGNESSNRSRVAELEARLASLKAQAREANSPDTFVQYARLTREANTVEKELVSIRGDNTASPTLPMLELLSAFLPTPQLARTARATMYRRVLGFLPVVLLWLYFRFATDNRGARILAADCDVFRPFAFLFNKIPTNCDASSDICETENICAVGYQLVAFVASSVVGRVFTGLKGMLR